jgi:predicted transcriptional regulator
MGSKLRRLSVAVDDRISEILERLSEEENKTISDIIRTAIITYAEVAEEPGHVEEIKKYEEFLMGRDHVIVDLEIWIALLDFVNDHGDEELWKTIEDVGYESGIEFKLRGLGLRDVFKHLEYKNILKVKHEDGVTVLVLSSRNETKLLIHYLKGVFKAMNVQAELIPGVRKIVVTEIK